MSFRLGYVKTIGIVNNGGNGRGFTNPCDLVLSKDQRIITLNRSSLELKRGARALRICSWDEDFLGEAQYGGGEGDGEYTLPTAMAFDRRERLYVTDEYLHRISIYDSNLLFLDKWGLYGSGPGELDGPAGIVVDSQDYVYITDQNNHRVQKFTIDGEYILEWGAEGQGAGQFNMPWGITLDREGHVYVADWRNDRIQKFTSEGKFLDSFGHSGEGYGEFHRPSSVALDDQGYIYVADWGNERVQVLAPDGGFKVVLRGQATVSKWAQEFFDSNPDEVGPRAISNLIPDLPEHLDTPSQISAQTEPYFWGPVSVTVDGENRLYVTETNRHRVQIYQRL